MMSEVTDRRRVKQASTSERVADEIRELIFSGGLVRGAKVPQDAIAERLGVSRLPVREALIALEADGLVYTEQHRGTYVADFTPEDLRDHYTICGLVHGLAASRAATSMTEDELAQLRELNESMSTETDATKLYDLHWRFHQLINRVGGTRRLRSILQQLSHNLPRSLFTGISPKDVDSEAAHSELIAAIEDKDPELAAELTRRHLAVEAELAIARLEREGLWRAA
jgi:DNA-binding GntR family transcriptional regulator